MLEEFNEVWLAWALVEDDVKELEELCLLLVSIGCSGTFFAASEFFEDTFILLEAFLRESKSLLCEVLFNELDVVASIVFDVLSERSDDLLD